ncbi:MAG: hypothetical protein LBM59_04525 [Ruminococcus sp.]|nr:hypothetical protein [Ruminococcus sp.]
MTKNEYLDEVRLNLAVLPKDEVDMAIRFYDEYLTDAGRGNEAAAMEELGKPYHLAKSIISEQSAFTRSAMYIEHKQTRKSPVPASVFSYAEPETAKLPNIKTAQSIDSKGINLEKPTHHDPTEKISKRAFILGMTAIIGTVVMVTTIVSLAYYFDMLKYLNPIVI